MTPTKLAPVIVTAVAPADGPFFAESFFTVGAGPGATVYVIDAVSSVRPWR